MPLEVLWYGVIGCSILFYVVLDGFDLGVGALHLTARSDEQRRVYLNAIGPVWDGNEVWIVVVMGALLAGFPNVYATIFSGFYSLLMFLILGLIFRAAAIEFRSKQESPRWRSVWDVTFSFASILVAFVLGLLLGNVIEGIPLNASQDFIGTFSLFFRPYPLLVALTALALFTMHGAIYLTMKTEGEPHAVVRRWINPAIGIFLFLYTLSTFATFFWVPHMIERMISTPFFWVFPLAALLAIVNVPLQVRKENFGWAFLSSCASISLLLILVSLGLFPLIVRSTLIPELHSLTIYNTAATPETLRTLLVVVAIGIPLVLAYSFWTYRVFRGKVKIEKSSY